MNNNIEEYHVGYEVAELLKEKGFDVHCNSFYLDNGNSFIDEVGNYNSQDQDENNNHSSAPTHSVAIKWIRENFGIHIMVDRSPRYKNRFDWFYLIKSGDGFNTQPIFSGYFDQLSEATEAAILYTVKNLI